MVNDPATAPMAQTKPRAAVFDFDGTLADTIEEARLIVNRLAPAYGFAPVSREMAESLRGGGVREAIGRLGIRPRQLPGLHVAVRRHLRARMAEVKPFPGIGQALRALTEGGLRLGILSSNSLENVEAFLRSAGLREFFSFVAGGSSLFGKSRHLRRLLAEELAGTKPGDVVYVGDETRDITAARKVGIRCAAVTWGANTAGLLASARPDYVFHSPADLAEAWGSHRP
jgi:phosphoglycolate phosphatase-like HAD superfamily hydrolase